jgi:hypothetical protein
VFGVVSLVFVELFEEGSEESGFAWYFLQGNFFLFVRLLSNAFILGFAAKIPNLRELLISTIGELSYSIYIGINEGDKAMKIYIRFGMVVLGLIIFYAGIVCIVIYVNFTTWEDLLTILNEDRLGYISDEGGCFYRKM